MFVESELNDGYSSEFPGVAVVGTQLYSCADLTEWLALVHRIDHLKTPYLKSRKWSKVCTSLTASLLTIDPWAYSLQTRKGLSVQPHMVFAKSHLGPYRAGRYRPSRTSSRQKGRCYQTVRRRDEGAAIPSCYCCWYRALPSEGDKTNGTKETGKEKQG